MEWHHGGDWAGFYEAQGSLPLDFSANVSPLGVPAGVRAAICAAATEADRYPDGACRALVRALAQRHGLRAEQVLCGAGASDLLYRLVRAAEPKRALLTAPSFGEYAAALETVHASVSYYYIEDDFIIKENILDSISRDIKLVILCQPNNPDGRTVDPSLARRVLARCREVGARLVVDESFVDFLDEPDRFSLTPLLARWPELVIVRAFTKFYGMAGLRLGYALSADEAFLSRAARMGPPWAVSGVAQAAGLAALRETDYAARLRALIRTERPFLYRALSELGFRVVPGEANFLLFESDRPLLSPLAQRGIALRGCGDFKGLDERWYRTAVRTREENERLITALREVIG